METFKALFRRLHPSLFIVLSTTCRGIKERWERWDEGEEDGTEWPLPVGQIKRCMLQCLLQHQCLLKEILFSCDKSSTKIASGGGTAHSVSSTPQ